MKKNLPKYITILLLSLVTVIHAQVRTSQPVVEPQSDHRKLRLVHLS